MATHKLNETSPEYPGPRSLSGTTLPPKDTLCNSAVYSIDVARTNIKTNLLQLDWQAVWAHKSRLVANHLPSIWCYILHEEILKSGKVMIAPMLLTLANSFGSCYCEAHSEIISQHFINFSLWFFTSSIDKKEIPFQGVHALSQGPRLITELSNWGTKLWFPQSTTVTNSAVKQHPSLESNYSSQTPLLYSVWVLFTLSQITISWDRVADYLGNKLQQCHNSESFTNAMMFHVCIGNTLGPYYTDGMLCSTILGLLVAAKHICLLSSHGHLAHTALIGQSTYPWHML